MLFINKKSIYELNNLAFPYGVDSPDETGEVADEV